MSKHTLFHFVLILCAIVSTLMLIGCGSSQDDIELDEFEEFFNELENAATETEEIITTSTAPLLPEIDVVSPVEQYFQWQGANGYGEICTHRNDTELIDFGEHGEILFSHDDLYFTGTDGHIDIVVNNKQVASIFFEADPSDNLSTGDIITITPEIRTRSGYEEKYSFPAKNIVVPELGNYVKVKSELTKAAIKNIRSFETCLSEFLTFEEGTSLLRMYAAEIKPGKIMDEISPFSIVLVLQESENRYYVFRLNDIIMFANGDVKISSVDRLYSMEFNNQRFSTLEGALEKLETDWWSKYDYEEIK